MINNIDSNNCTGCSACFSVCKNHSITMVEDNEGFLIPKVDNLKCIDCKLCEKVCTVNKPMLNQKTIIKSYAFKWNHKERHKSSSGGVFASIATYYIEKLEGYVCGCVLDGIVVKHIVTNDPQIVSQMQGSKYVQSDLNDCFKVIIDLLKQDKHVLFCGTSCQVQGLYKLIHQLRISDSTLLTIDFFCHGVPSPLIWREYIKFYEKHYKRTVSDFRFRSKEYGWGKKARQSNHLNTIIYHSNKIEKKDNYSLCSALWKRIFFSNLCLRQFCYHCPYTTEAKPADLTIGDFWGIEKFYPEFDDGEGCSAIVVRTEKANKMLNKLSNIEKIEVNLYEIENKQANAFRPSSYNTNRKHFWNDYRKNGFGYVAKKYFGFNLIGQVKYFIKRTLFEFGLHDLS